MLELAILYIIVFTIVSVVLIEFVYNKVYQDKKVTPVEHEEEPETEFVPEEIIEEEPEEVIEETRPEVEPEEVIEEVPEPEVETKEVIEETPEVEAIEEEAEKVEEAEAEETVEEIVETKELPACEYPAFTHVRLVEMGLSDDEATEFVNELIPQLEEQIPLIEEAINSADFHKIERLTHGVKGSATNIGTGGISDLLVEFNTYLKTGEDVDIVKAYYKHYIDYTAALKEQYS